MPANEFEKQVQDIMQELKLPPSPPVWENIEEQIRKKKDRRRIIFWIMFLFLILSGGLWLTIGTNRSENNQKAKLQQKEEIKTGATTDLSSKKQNIEADKQNEKTSLKIREENNKPIAISKTGMEKQERSNPAIVKRSMTKNIKQEKSNAFVVKNQDQQPGIENQKEQGINTTTLKQKEDKQNEGVLEQPVKTSNKIIDEAKQNADTTQHADSSALTKPGITEILNHPGQQKKRPNNKWQKQVTAEIGMSDYGYSLADSQDKFYSAAVTSQGFGSPYIIAANVPKEITKGTAFAFGVELAKQISPRLKISFGLQYHYFSTHTKTGAAVKKDSVVNYGADLIAISHYYRNDGQSNYTNSFHVLEIPVTVQYRPFKNLPLDLGAGVSYGRLLKTNALSFNEQRNIYYRNKKDYLGNYLDIFSSVQYEWLHQTKFSIQSGPNFSVNTTKLQRSNYYGMPHLFSVGLKTSIKF